ncbi:hypothetical protein MHU86_20204 [Fragilaria crotonensis]|nr:hypothetical protein MHU86_20204 [Fragilaria crotonensis]
MGRFPSGRRNPENPGVILFSSGQAPTKKQFNLTIPPVPPETYDAIASRITTLQPWLEQKAKLDKAQQKAQLSRENLVLAQERLRQLQERREQARKLRQTDTLNAMRLVDQSTQQSFEEEMKEKENEWNKRREQIELEIEEDLKRVRTELEAEAASEEMEDSEEAEDSPPAKRFKLDRDVEPSHRVSLDDEEKEEGEESESADEEAILRRESAVENDKDEDESKLSFAKKKAFDTFQKKADELTGMKVNMSWLLKTIIQKENERKKKDDELKEKENS